MNRVDRNIINSLLDNYGSRVITIVDVGAMGRLEFPDGFEERIELHAFEPNPVEYEKLKKKYAANSFRKLVINKVALADKQGRGVFQVTNHASMSSFLKADISNYKKHFGNYREYEQWEKGILPKDTIEVDIQRGDDYFGNTCIDLVKIDTQGSEQQVLEGFKKLLQLHKISLIKLEVSTIPVYKDQVLFSDIDLYLRGMGYTLAGIITYRSEDLPLVSSRHYRADTAPCSDAIYSCNDNNIPKEMLLKKALLLAWMGCDSLSRHLSALAGLSTDETTALFRASEIKSGQLIKRSFKAILPPIITWWLKKLYAKLHR